MPCATSQVSTTLIGHSRSSGASIQSRISPKRERCSRRAAISRRSRRDLLETIAQSPHGRDAHRSLLDLLAQAVDVYLDRVVADLFAPLAQALHQLVFAHEAARALPQHLQQAQLARRQLDHLVVDG